MTTPTDPTTLRTALEALVAKWDDEAPRIPDRRGSIVLTSAAHELRSLLETHRTTLATPAPAADEAHAHVWHYYDGNETEGTEYRCRCGAMTDDQPAPAADEARCVHDGCPFPFDRDWHHSVLRTMGRHPFQPAPTPAQTTPPATEPSAAHRDGCHASGLPAGLSCGCSPVRARSGDTLVGLLRDDGFDIVPRTPPAPAVDGTRCGFRLGCGGRPDDPQHQRPFSGWGSMTAHDFEPNTPPPAVDDWYHGDLEAPR